MKNLLILTSIIFSIVLISSCSKKYDGCCTYTIKYKQGNPDKVVNDCFTQADKQHADEVKAAYNSAIYDDLNNNGQPYDTQVSGPGCNY